MKIGILTYHRSHNYGALLQAIALRKMLSDMGHEVTFIDYWPAYHRHMYALFSFPWMMSRKGLKGKMSYLKSCINNRVYRKKRRDNFEKFISEYIEPYTSSETETYDIIFHGSDQIWRKQPEIGTYNPVYFGKHQIQAKQKVSYAASMGILPENETDKLKFKDLLSNLDRISVRERDLLDSVVSLEYPDARQDIDPTLLLSSDDWISMFDLKKHETGEKYALYYKIKDSFDVACLRRFAKSRGLKLKIIHSKATGKNTDYQVTTAGPKQFMDLIYNANFVFTSSFHGLVFSLLFHKPFFASFPRNSGRAASLLETLKISGRLLSYKSDIPSDLQPVDYNMVDNTLNQLKTSSRNFLYSQVSD